MTLRPIGDQVIIEPDDREEFTKSGLIIPDVAQETPMKGLVLAVGPRVNEDITKYDRVIYNRWGAQEISESRVSEPVIILREEHVIAVVSDG